MARVLIGYDINDHRRRNQALRMLRAQTACYQNSFFDCELDPRQLDELCQELTELLEPTTDGLVVAWLRPGQRSAIGHRWTEGGQGLFLIT